MRKFTTIALALLLGAVISLFSTTPARAGVSTHCESIQVGFSDFADICMDVWWHKNSGDFVIDGTLVYAYECNDYNDPWAKDGVEHVIKNGAWETRFRTISTQDAKPCNKEWTYGSNGLRIKSDCFHAFVNIETLNIAGWGDTQNVYMYKKVCE